jgi:hypothetical protein
MFASRSKFLSSKPFFSSLSLVFPSTHFLNMAILTTITRAILGVFLYGVLTVVVASPTRPPWLRVHELIAYSPPIQSPAVGDKWFIGQQRKIVWDTTRIPPEIWNTTGLILLGRRNTTDENEHLDISAHLLHNPYCETGSEELLGLLDHPLAKDFPIVQGKINVTVPNVEPSNDYIVVRAYHRELCDVSLIFTYCHSVR